MRNPDNWPAETNTVKEVTVYEDGDGFYVTNDEGWTFGVTAKEAENKPLPETGHEVVLLGGFGRPIRGIFINDVEYRYISKEQADKERQEWLDNYERQKRESFYENIRDWIMRKNALDTPFRERMDRFAGKGFEEFWRESGAYELFTVEQANALYNHAVESAGADNAEVWLDTFYNMDYDKQKEAFPGLDDGHSGNTFGGMVGLAKAVARGDAI